MSIQKTTHASQALIIPQAKSVDLKAARRRSELQSLAKNCINQLKQQGVAFVPVYQPGSPEYFKIRRDFDIHFNNPYGAIDLKGDDYNQKIHVSKFSCHKTEYGAFITSLEREILHQLGIPLDDNENNSDYSCVTMQGSTAAFEHKDAVKIITALAIDGDTTHYISGMQPPPTKLHPKFLRSLLHTLFDVNKIDNPAIDIKNLKETLIKLYVEILNASLVELAGSFAWNDDSLREMPEDLLMEIIKNHVEIKCMCELHNLDIHIQGMDDKRHEQIFDEVFNKILPNADAFLESLKEKRITLNSRDFIYGNYDDAIDLTKKGPVGCVTIMFGTAIEDLALQQIHSDKLKDMYALCHAGPSQSSATHNPNRRLMGVYTQ
jgi:hypothetical protein